MTESSIRRRLVGGELRRYRENLGYTLDEAAAVLECDRSKISRVETGQRGIRPRELRELLSGYAVADGEQEVLVRLASRRDSTGWWDEHAGVLPGPLAEYYSLEPAAAEILVYDALAVPSLLRTPEYEDAITGAGDGHWPFAWPGQARAACELRQQLVLGGDRQVSVVIGENGIRRQAGDMAVMAGQLTRVADLAGDHPGVTVQVLPSAATAFAASGSGGFSVLRFGPALAVVFVPALTGGFFTASQDEAGAYLRAFTRLRSAALPPADTTRLLREAAAELRPPWD